MRLEDLTADFLKTPAGFYNEIQNEDLPEEIQGKKVQSKEEARSCLALDFLGLEYIYQYEFAGGTRVRGGQQIDILAKTVPLWTPIYIQSKYWHGTTFADTDTMKQREFRKATRGWLAEPLLVEDYELTSVSQAIETYRRTLNL